MNERLLSGVSVDGASGSENMFFVDGTDGLITSHRLIKGASRVVVRGAAWHRIRGSPHDLRRASMRRAGLLLSLSLSAVLVLAGCVPEGLSEAAKAQLDAVEPGEYWVADSGAGLELFEMPRFRGDEGRWRSFPGAAPEWFSETGLYSLDDGGEWALEIPADEDGLDGLLQVWDPPPRLN